MRKIIATTGLLAAAAATTVALPMGAAQAKGEYQARASLAGQSCQESTGTTVQKVTLDNKRSTSPVQFKVSRTLTLGGKEQNGGGTDFYKVGAGKSKVVTALIPEDMTLSLRVASPEMGKDWMRLSEVIPADPDCHYYNREPKATLGGATCVGSDTVVQVNLDNRKSTDDQVSYEVQANNTDSNDYQTVVVKPASMRNTYVSVIAGHTIELIVTDTATGDVLLDEQVASRSC